MNQSHSSNNNAGFEVETGLEDQQSQGQHAAKAKKSNELKQNFQAVFGHGIGKLSLILTAIVLCIVVAFAYRGMTKPNATSDNAEMHFPNPPEVKVSIDPISEKEAQRRAERSALEAQLALENGETYQPGFDPNIMGDQTSRANSDGYLSFNLPGGAPRGGDARSTILTLPGGQPINQQSVQPLRQTDNYSSIAQEKQRLEREYIQAMAEREKYISRIQNQALTQAEKLFGDQGGDSVNNIGNYSTVSYLPEIQEVQQTTDDSSTNNSVIDKTANPLGDPSGKLLIKTGNLMYATLDSEVNTDAAHDTIATIHGGEWDGSKLIGRVEQGQNNIVLRFTILAPQDSRKTMRIDAVALREEDASMGVAEIIDHHTFSRYTSLAVASLLAGYGRAYANTSGTTVISPGGVVTQTNNKPSDREVFGNAVGELGSALSSEVRKGFDRPTTYITPANKGFGLFFMQDVYEQGQR